jgi:hypothetical protein
MIFQRPANIDTNPLKLIERSEPLAGQGDILVRVRTCGGRVIDLGAIRYARPRSSCLTTCSSLRLIRVWAEIKRFAGSLGISPEDAFGVFDFFNAGAAVPGGAQEIASDDFTATRELTMACKDAPDGRGSPGATSWRWQWC